MQLYIANGSRQIHTFAYRLPEKTTPSAVPIAIGAQIKIDDLTAEGVDAIIEQHRRYGVIDVTELPRLKGPFSGLCYSTNVINMDKIQTAMQKRHESLEEAGKRIREEAAVAVNSQIENNIDDTFGFGEARDNSPLKNFEMTVVEEEPRGGYQTEKPLGVGIRVSKSGPERSNGRGGRGNKAA